MDFFRRNSIENNNHNNNNECVSDAVTITSLRERVRDLELLVFDLKKALADLQCENTQLRAWNTTADNQTSEWFGKSNPSLSHSLTPSLPHSSIQPSELSVEESVCVDVEGDNLTPLAEGGERMSFTSTTTTHTHTHMQNIQENKQQSERAPEEMARLNRHNTIIFTNDSDFDNFKIDKRDIQMKCQVGKGSFGVVWKGMYRESPVAVKLFISEEIDIRSEVYAMSKVVGLEHVMDLIGVCYLLNCLRIYNIMSVLLQLSILPISVYLFWPILTTYICHDLVL
jgi:hypothetical protein